MSHPDDIAQNDGTQNDGAQNDGAMSIIEHLTELRKRLMWSVLAFFIGFTLLFPFADEILRVLFEPVRQILISRGQDAELQSTAAQEYFFAIIRVSMLGGLAIAIPVIIYHLWSFVAPGLYKNEKLAVLPFLIAAPVMFILGGTFAHFIVTPLAMQFFIGFSDIVPAITELVTGRATVEATDELRFVFQGKVSDVLDLSLKFVFAFGLCFQLPVALTLLGKVGLISADGLKVARKYAIVGIMFTAAIVTPPDVITQIILFTVVYGLYEISIWLVKWVEPKYDEEDEIHDEEDA